MHIAELVLGTSTPAVLAGRSLLILARKLPDHAVCALLPDLGDGRDRVVCDPEKPDALEHVQEMLEELGSARCEQPV